MRRGWYSAWCIVAVWRAWAGGIAVDVDGRSARVGAEGCAVGRSTVDGPAIRRTPRSKFSARPSFAAGALLQLRFADNLILICPNDDSRGLRSNLDGPASAHPYTSDNAAEAEKELREGRGALPDSHLHGIDVEFEEDARSAAAVGESAAVAGDAVLVGAQGLRPRGVIDGRHYRQEVLEESKR